MRNYYENYLELRNRIDHLVLQLEDQHTIHMKCKTGCDQCCMDYSVFPVEFYSILNRIKKLKEKPETNEKANREDCIFLINHRCSIYSERPVICRTHGLPLLYMGEDGNWELSACELNFTDFDMDEFSDENTFPQDKFNSKLFMLNHAFVKDFKDQSYGEFDLIPIQQLKDHF